MFTLDGGLESDFNGLFVSSVLFKDIKNDCFFAMCAPNT